MKNLNTEYPTRVKPADSDYELFSFRDKTTSVSNDGSPVAKAAVWNELWGAIQWILKQAKITPSGNVETSNDSDICNGIFNTHYNGGYTARSPLATRGNPENLELSQMNHSTVSNTTAQGTNYRLASALYNGGILFYTAASAPGNVTNMRRTYYDIDAGDIVYVSGDSKILWTPSGGLDLTGIPNTSRIQNVTIETQSSSSCTSYQISCTMTNVSGSWRISSGGGFAHSGPATGSAARVWIDYDPTLVD